MPVHFHIFFASTLSLFVLSFGTLQAEEKPAEAKPGEAKAAAKITFDEHVMPIFREKCFSCHNGDKTSGGLNLTTYSNLMQGGSSGDSIAPSDAENSFLYMLVIHSSEPAMPPKSDKLPENMLATIRQWIDGGALENAGSKARPVNKPKVSLALNTASLGKPEGPPPMPGKLALEPVVYTPRSTAVTAIAASPWAPLLAVGGQKQVLLYHSETLELLGVLPFSEGTPNVLKFSRNGSLLLAGGGHGAKLGRVAVWNIASGERLFTVGEEFDEVLAADISSDQTRIALGGPGKVVRVYSTEDGRLEYELKKHTDWIYTLEFSPDGILLATGDRSGGMFVWEAHTGREYLSLTDHKVAVTDVSWRADSNILSSCSEDGTVKLWEMENGRVVKSFNAHGGGVASLEFAKDGRLVSCGRDKVAKLWDANGNQQRAFEAFGDLALSVAISHDNSRVVSGDWTGAIRVWASADGKRLGELTANPAPLAVRVGEAVKQLDAAKAAHDRLNKAVAASKAALDKINADLAAQNKLLADSTAAQKTATEQVAALQKSIPALQAEITTGEKTLTDRKPAQALLTEAVTKALDASKRLAADTELAQTAAKLKQSADKLDAEMKALEASVAQKKTQLQTMNTQLAAAQKQAADSVPVIQAAQKAIPALTAQVKPAQDKLSADTQALAPASAALTTAQAAFDKLKAAEAAAKGNNQQANAGK